jgi:predicted ATP-grasp superfamily ATP-dependent carboligase
MDARMANLNRSKKSPEKLVLIVGASARSAAFSAVRAGLTPVASDLFGDRDLRAVARFVELKGEYPHGFKTALREMPEGPFIYTGGLENHPTLVDQLAKTRLLWGNDGSRLKRCRNPLLLHRALKATGLDPPEIRSASHAPEDLDGWLKKPLRGSGGGRIEPASEPLPGRRAEPFYLQRFAPGKSYSAVFVGFEATSSFLGATRQLVGEPWLHARPFSWCGNVGPASLPEAVQRELEEAGAALTRVFRLRGLFGLDFLLAGETSRPVDLNPRYTGSVEILEHALGFHALALHARACIGERAVPLRRAPRPAAFFGKAILFAPRALTAKPSLAPRHEPDPARFPELADLPLPGATIAKGKPLMTVFARARGEEDCLLLLKKAARQALRHFQPSAAASYYRGK